MSAPAKKSVFFFYDVLSPYSWFAFEVLCRYQHRWNINLKLKPFFVAGIMQGSDNSPPGRVPNKARYMQSDIARCAKYFQVPVKIPENIAEVMFVKGSLTPQRFITSVDMTTPKLTEEVTRQLWYRIFHTHEDITELESLRQAGQKAGMSENQVQTALSKLKNKAVKDRLKQYTDEALSHGAFGSPSIITHVDGQDQLVFGSDRFPILAQMLGEKWEGPVPGHQDQAKL